MHNYGRDKKARQAPGHQERKCCAAEAACIAQVGEEVLGRAAKIEVNKESCTIVGDGSTQDVVEARVRQIKNAIQNTEQDYEREKLNERVARLSGGVAILQVSVMEVVLDHEHFTGKLEYCMRPVGLQVIWKLPGCCLEQECNPEHEAGL